jgi:Na+/melibiose symporter-like transporter
MPPLTSVVNISCAALGGTVTNRIQNSNVKLPVPKFVNVGVGVIVLIILAPLTAVNEPDDVPNTGVGLVTVVGLVPTLVQVCAGLVLGDPVVRD